MKKTWTMPIVTVDGFAANEYVAACTGVTMQCAATVTARELGLGTYNWIYTAPDSIGGISVAHPVVTSSLSQANAHAIGEPCYESLNIQDYSSIKVGSADTFFDANGNKTSNHAPSYGYAIHKHTTHKAGVFCYAFEKMDANGYPNGDGYHWFYGGANPTS